MSKWNQAWSLRTFSFSRAHMPMRWAWTVLRCFGTVRRILPTGSMGTLYSLPYLLPQAPTQRRRQDRALTLRGHPWEEMRQGIWATYAAAVGPIHWTALKCWTAVCAHLPPMQLRNSAHVETMDITMNATRDILGNPGPSPIVQSRGWWEYVGESKAEWVYYPGTVLWMLSS